MSFDRIARHYRLLETIAFGGGLQRARVYWIDNLPPPTRVLIIGEGNGRFLCELLRSHPNIDIDCVDISVAMLALAQRRAHKMFPGSRQRVRFIHQDVREWSAQRSYDLLVTHFFLDCFRREEMDVIVDKLAGAAAPNATWLLTDFTIPTTGKFARMHGKFRLRLMYWFFRRAAGISASELVDPSPYLQATGFTRGSFHLSRSGMVKSELWQRHSVPTSSAIDLASRGKTRGCRH